MFESGSDVPLLTEYNPHTIPQHYQVIKDIRTEFNYQDQGVNQVMLSGSVGSGKSLLMSHIIITHCLENPGAIFGIGRLTMPELKDTLLKMILDHMGEAGELVNYDYNKTKSEIKFSNGSKIMSFSWHDQKYKKFRSHKFSGFAIEELTENDDKNALEAILMRCGRLPQIREKIVICATNPDDPEHWAYKWFIERERATNIHVYYSLTKDNPFLDPNYISMLKENLDPQMAKRMLEGIWLPIGKENIYYNYKAERNFYRRDYDVVESLPISISFDFNIAKNKPMSCVLSQYNGAFHWFDESVIEGARTEDIMEDLANRGCLDHRVPFYEIHGDQTGKARDPRCNWSNYDVITKFLDEYKRKDGRRVRYELCIQTRNPPIKKRHNLMNGAMYNVKGQTRFYVYAGAKTLHEGCRLTKLKKGGQYIEDDSKPYQHITTAAGYRVCYTLDHTNSKPQGTVLL